MITETINEDNPALEPVRKENPGREYLLQEKERIERELKKAEKQDFNRSVISTIRKVEDISEAIITMQESINMIWKRTKQLETELKDLLLKENN